MSGSTCGRSSRRPSLTPNQLNLLGTPDLPEDLDLGSVQRLVIRFVREHGSISKDEAGAIAHQHRGRHSADERCAFCSIDGEDLLAALARRRQVERGAEGDAQLPRARRGAGDLPEGF